MSHGPRTDRAPADAGLRGPRRWCLVSGGVGGLAVAAVVAVATGALGACSDACCTFDELPIPLVVAASPAAGGLRLNASAPDANAPTFEMALDTGSALTYVRQAPGERSQTVGQDFWIRSLTIAPKGDLPVRATLNGIDVLPIPLDPAGPPVVLGGAFLKNFSLEIHFAAPSVTFWSRQGASDAFLSSAMFAVVHFDIFGGGEIMAESRPDFLGFTGPIDMPATRVLFRGCAAPAPFDPLPDTPMPVCAKRGDDVPGSPNAAAALATGADLALMLSTGIGPLVLGRSAWNRVKASSTTPPADPVDDGTPLSVPSLAAPITGVGWTHLSRLALVDLESDAAVNPGPCAELGRARRLEWLEVHQDACVQACDTDLRDPSKAQNAAGYIEVGPDQGILVAVLPDDAELLQSLRAEIRPEGPELDGLIGAATLAQLDVELDYKNGPPRGIFACEPTTLPRAACRTSPRCPRLSNAGEVRSCFGLPPRNSPPTVCR